MNAGVPPPSAVVAHAMIGLDGRLLSADPALEALNARAGGAIGTTLAVPQLATVVRLARRLGIIVSRPVTVADEDADYDLWVRAQPEGEAIRLSASGWRERPAWHSPTPADASADFQQADAEWRWETDAALRLTFVSIAAGHRLGFDAIGLLGAPLTALFALGVDQAGDVPLVDALARREPFSHQPARLRGNNSPVVLGAVVRRDNAGSFAGFAGAARAAEPLPATAPADTPDDGLPTAFTEGLDRALRRPLAQIIANADSIHAQIEGPVGTSYADYASDIASAGRHLLGLVDDLVDLQAVEKPDFVLPLEVIDLADVARRAAGLLAVRAADAGVFLNRPAPTQSTLAHGDFRRTLQILVNLIGNAIRYAPRGTSVDVVAGAVGAISGVTVTDRGKGVSEDDQERIFAKFERVDPSEPGGNGLGLYIARRLARAMAGDLTLVSKPGEGARFTLTLRSADEA